MASYWGKQSDDDYQRHNASRHHREQSGQDRFRYSIDGEMRARGELHYMLRCEGQVGPRDGQWVNAKEVIHRGNYVLA